MGTAKQWIEVAFAGCFWGGFMLLWSVSKRRKANIRPYLSFSDALAWGLMGLWFGLVTAFGWQAIRTPIIFLVVAAFAGSLIVGFLGRPKTLKSSTR
jgi:uncharacterized membrane protein YuzA (DUF378 family)